jgi:hypothetical protein
MQQFPDLNRKITGGYMAKFKKGISGNPTGRKPGVSDKRTKLRDLLTPHAPELIEKLIDQAKNGDPNAMKICIDRLIPKIKDDAINLSDQLHGSLTEKSLAIFSMLTNGKINPYEAEILLQSLTNTAKLTETDELITRIENLEGKIS